MHIVIRKYSGRGASALFDLFEKRTGDAQNHIGTTKGLISYTLARSADGGGFSVTVCEDESGIEDSMQKSREWIAANAAALGAPAPEVFEGKVLIQLKK